MDSELATLQIYLILYLLKLKLWRLYTDIFCISFEMQANLVENALLERNDKRIDPIAKTQLHFLTHATFCLVI